MRIDMADFQVKDKDYWDISMDNFTIEPLYIYSFPKGIKPNREQELPDLSDCLAYNHNEEFVLDTFLHLIRYLRTTNNDFIILPGLNHFKIVPRIIKELTIYITSLMIDSSLPHAELLDTFKEGRTLIKENSTQNREVYISFYCTT